MPENEKTETVETTEVEETTEVVEETEEPKVFDEAYVKQLREEAARHRVEKQKEAQARLDLEAKLKEFEDAKLSAEERTARDFQEAVEKASLYKQKALENSLFAQLAIAAQEAGITDVKAAVKLADRELIQADDSGNVSNIDDVVSALRDEYQSLFASAAPRVPNTGATNPTKTPQAKKYTREDIKKMSPERMTELLNKGDLNHLL